MNRRNIVMTMGASAVLGIGGCLDEPRESTLEPKKYPALPERLTSDSVVDFVREHETVRFYNHIRSNERNPESIDATCSAVLDRETESAFYVLTHCGGSAALEDGVAEYPSSAYGITTYRVTESRVQRVTASPAERRDGYLVLLANFDASEHDLSVVVTAATKSEDEPILEESQTLDSEGGVEYRLESGDTSAYELTLSRDDEPDVTFDGRFSRSADVGIYITADGTELGALSSLP